MLTDYAFDIRSNICLSCRILQTLRDCPAQGSEPNSNPTNPYPRGPGNPALTTEDEPNEYDDLSALSASPSESADQRG